MFRFALALGLAVAASAAQVRINCGGPALPAIGWLADTGKYRTKPSDAYHSPKQVAAKGTWRPVYDTHAYAPKTLVYKIPLLAGPYTISLLFAETYNKEAGKRVMSVKLGSRVVTKSLDVFAAVGGAFKAQYLSAGAVTVGRDQVLYIEIATAGAGNPMLSGIVIDGQRPDALLDDSVTPPPSPPPPSNACGVGKSANAFMMNIGGPADAKLNYAAENPAYISKGSLIATNTATTPAASFFRSERYTFGQTLTVRIPVPKGAYTITTSHAETYHAAAGLRYFDILVNGQVRKTKVDVVAAVGAKKVYEAVFTRVASVDGALTVTFRKGLENPFVNAIRIVGPGANRMAVGGGCKTGPPKPSPKPTTGCRTAKTVTGSIADNSGFLMNVGGKALAKIGFAADNVNYIPDKFKGDTFVADMPVDVGTSTWGPVWASSRWTSLPALTYIIPAPKGKFRIALFLVESYYAKNGARVLDIHINGKVVDAKVDIHKRVGKNKPLYLQFDNIVPVDGKLTISLKKVVENPTLNAIYIQGAGIGTTAIGGFEDGTC